MCKVVVLRNKAIAFWTSSLLSPSSLLKLPTNADGWTDGHVTSKIYRMRGKPNFLTHGASQGALRLC